MATRYNRAAVVERNLKSMEANNELKDFLGEKIKVIYGIQNIDFHSNEDYFFFNKIIIATDRGNIYLSPLVDSDEVQIEISQKPDHILNDEKTEILADFYGEKINYTWTGINTNGYEDVFMISLKDLKPSVLILAEGSVLKLFRITPYSRSALSSD